VIISANLAEGLPDTSLRTWVHESLHARQPYAPTYHAEYAAAAGYEEGMVEGLARHILRHHAGTDAFVGTFDYYVAAYTALAQVFDIRVEGLWMRLWQEPPGRVREAFPYVLRDLAGNPGGRAVTDAVLQRVRAVADSVFAATRGGQAANPLELARVWRLVR
jgi:hypothetical protein